jgi:Tfp pilus assembly protein PilN
MALTTTGLLPIDPAVSPQRVNRILTIRANLLPSEIIASRNASRIRFGLLGAVLLAVILVGAWYVHALRVKSEAEGSRQAITDQIQAAQVAIRSHQDVTDAVSQRDEINETLRKLLANDLPWTTLLDRVRAASPDGLVITTINGSLDDDPNILTVGTLNIDGTAPDKKTVARYIDTLRKMEGITNPYVTTVNRDNTSNLFSFSLTAGITTESLCGKWTETCKTGGK